MSRVKNLIEIIKSCEKHEFDTIIKSYLKEIYGFERIVLTDGKDDRGIDIKVFDLKGKNIQYQLTTHKSETNAEKKLFEKKLLSDIKKAQENSKTYSYSSSLFFFYSKALTNKVIREFKKIALNDYGIQLEIIDAKQIAEESEEYLELQRTIFDLSGLAEFKLKESLFEDENENLIFELISFGKPSDVKLQIIEAFVLKSLYFNNEMSYEEIVDKCVGQFKTSENNIFYDRLFARLQTSKRITKNQQNKFILTSDEQNRISSLYKQQKIDEENFSLNIYKILKKYSQEEYINKYIIYIKDFYTNNFNSDIVDILNETTSNDLHTISRDFMNFISKNVKDEKLSKKLAIELFTFCGENKFIQKLCAGKVFSDKTNLNRLEKYANTQKRIFVDTQIAIYALCYYYNPRLKSKSFFHKTTKYLIQFCRKNKIVLYIPAFYSWEVQNHVRDALNLIPFTFLPEFSRLGKSRNVFFNYYQNYVSGVESISYQQFLEKFGFKTKDSYKIHNKIIKSYLEDLGFLIFDMEYEYDIEETKNIVQDQLIIDGKSKTKFGLNNDSIMLEFLAHDDVEVHPLKPIFITWDKTFFKIHNKYFLKNPTSQRWLLFTPSKFIDNYSLLNFTIDSETVSDEIIALISDELIFNTHSLLDSLVFILNPNDEIGLEYTKKLAELRDEEIYKVRDNQIIPLEELEGEVVIDDIFYKLTSHYREEDNKIDLFKEVFTKSEFFDDIINIITKTINEYYETRKFNDKIIIEFDKIIETMVKNKLN